MASSEAADTNVSMDPGNAANPDMLMCNIKQEPVEYVGDINYNYENIVDKIDLNHSISCNVKFENAGNIIGQIFASENLELNVAPEITTVSSISEDEFNKKKVNSVSVDQDINVHNDLSLECNHIIGQVNEVENNVPKILEANSITEEEFSEKFAKIKSENTVESHINNCQVTNSIPEIVNVNSISESAFETDKFKCLDRSDRITSQSSSSQNTMGYTLVELAKLFQQKSPSISTKPAKVTVKTSKVLNKKVKKQIKNKSSGSVSSKTKKKSLSCVIGLNAKTKKAKGANKVSNTAKSKSSQKKTKGNGVMVNSLIGGDFNTVYVNGKTVKPDFRGKKSSKVKLPKLKNTISNDDKSKKPKKLKKTSDDITSCVKENLNTGICENITGKSCKRKRIQKVTDNKKIKVKGKTRKNTKKNDEHNLNNNLKDHATKKHDSNTAVKPATKTDGNGESNSGIVKLRGSIIGSCNKSVNIADIKTEGSTTNIAIKTVAKNENESKPEFKIDPEEVEKMKEKFKNPVICQECGKCLPSKGYLERHMVLHSPDHIFVCQWCGKEFHKRSTLTKHSRVHNGEKPYVCKQCGASFPHNGSLWRHMKFTHAGEKPYKCDQCGKCFGRSSYLECHLASHNGVRPYTCMVCNKGFLDKPGLIRHSRTHTGEKMYQCELCDKKISSKKGLREHMNTHTGDKPYVCGTCSRGFGNTQGLQRHVKTHLPPVYKHFCDYCGKGFTRSCGLKRHIDSHKSGALGLGRKGRKKKTKTEPESTVVEVENVNNKEIENN